MKPTLCVILPALALCVVVAAPPSLDTDRVKTMNGVVESKRTPSQGVRSFKGIPFAQPPVGDLRWREPQPPGNWSGVQPVVRGERRCMMQGCFLNFIKTGNPNDPGLPEWPAYRPETNYQRMRIDVKSQAEPERDRARYLALDAIIAR